MQYIPICINKYICEPPRDPHGVDVPPEHRPPPPRGEAPVRVEALLTPVVLGLARSFHLVIERRDPLEGIVGPLSSYFKLVNFIQKGMRANL